MDQTRKAPNKALIAIIVIALLALIAGAVVYANRQTASDTSSSQTSQTENTTSGETDTENSSESASTGEYKDGEYAATGDYSTPGGRQSIDVKLTLKDGVITAVTADGDATGGESAEHQQDFESGYEPLVLGKNIDEVSLSRVAGSSLTSNGFNDALEQIKSEASA